MRKPSQKDQILTHFLTGASLTPLEALNNFGAFRLSAVVHKLKEEGWDIESKLIHDKRNNKMYSKYRLSDEVEKPEQGRLAYIEGVTQ